jgi:uncharacterized SAM-binding protein YcdF (DUF218 family)
LNFRLGGRAVRWLAGTLLLVVVAAWAAGFALFVSDAMRGADRRGELRSADGIVALTGGAERVRAAVQLLIERRAPILLISGVGHATDLADLARQAGVDPKLLDDRVTLGRSATTTRGNANETAAWADANQLHSIIVVTANYHMRRALLELHRAIPAVTLQPAPVMPATLRTSPDWPTLRLLAAEYTKWLVASIW